MELFTCNNVTVDLNNNYRGILPRLRAGEIQEIPLSDFRDKTGNTFPTGEKIKTIDIHAERPDGISGEINFIISR